MRENILYVPKEKSELEKLAKTLNKLSPEKTKELTPEKGDFNFKIISEEEDILHIFGGKSLKLKKEKNNKYIIKAGDMWWPPEVEITLKVNSDGWKYSSLENKSFRGNCVSAVLENIPNSKAIIYSR